MRNEERGKYGCLFRAERKRMRERRIYGVDKIVG
jgi:hypothetical protein